MKHSKYTLQSVRRVRYLRQRDRSIYITQSTLLSVTPDKFCMVPNLLFGQWRSKFVCIIAQATDIEPLIIDA